MKAILQDHNHYILRFDKGEEVVAGLTAFAKEQGIFAAAFFGIGACGSLDLAYYDLNHKNYITKTFTEDLEIVSLNGNIAVKEDKPVIHVHGQFGRADFSALAGHVMKLAVSVTCEVFLTKLEGKMARELNSDFNLNLLS